MYATHASRQVLVLDGRKAGRFDHALEVLLRRKLADAFDQILVRLPLAGQQLSHRRDHCERVLVVEPLGSRDEHRN